jgi:hypothetical protein
VARPWQLLVQKAQMYGCSTYDASILRIFSRAQTLGLLVRLPLEAWMFAFVLCVDSSLIPRPRSPTDCLYQWFSAFVRPRPAKWFSLQDEGPVVKKTLVFMIITDCSSHRLLLLLLLLLLYYYYYYYYYRHFWNQNTVVEAYFIIFYL